MPCSDPLPMNPVNPPSHAFYFSAGRLKRRTRKKNLPLGSAALGRRPEAEGVRPRRRKTGKPEGRWALPPPRDTRPSLHAHRALFRAPLPPAATTPLCSPEPSSRCQGACKAGGELRGPAHSPASARLARSAPGACAPPPPAGACAPLASCCSAAGTSALPRCVGGRAPGLGVEPPVSLAAALGAGRARPPHGRSGARAP